MSLPVGCSLVPGKNWEETFGSPFSALHRPIIYGYLLIVGAKIKWIKRDLSKISLGMEPDLLHLKSYFYHLMARLI